MKYLIYFFSHPILWYLLYMIASGVAFAIKMRINRRNAHCPPWLYIIAFILSPGIVFYLTLYLWLHPAEENVHTLKFMEYVGYPQGLGFVGGGILWLAGLELQLANYATLHSVVFWSAAFVQVLVWWIVIKRVVPRRKHYEAFLNAPPSKPVYLESYHCEA